MDDLVTFRTDPAKLPKRRGIVGPLLTIIFGSLLVAFAPFFIRFDTVAEYWAAEQDVIIVAALVSLVVLVAVSTHGFLATHPRFTGRISLRLDSEGLTQTSQFRTRRWAWRELPAFTYEAEQIPPNVAFHLPGQDPSDSRGGCIEDLYDSPLAEVAARLNEFRERALERAESNTE